MRVVLAAALLCAAPVALASWSAPGSTEPDTPRDRDEGRMWLDPDVALAGERVYFNAIATTGTGTNFGAASSSLGGGASPNHLGSALAPQGNLAVLAYLGVWKDCDRDGYVGHAEGALFAYRSELLDDASVCPVGGPFHANGWVWEFRWIGPNKGVDAPLRYLHDGDARVWADIGVPEAEPHFECRVTPLPRGTTARTGGLAQAADCQTGFAATQALAAAEAGTGAPVGFDDPYHPERDCAHPLNRPVGLWRDANACPGDAPGLLAAETGEPSFTTWDCSRPKGTADVRDPTTSSGRGMLSAVSATNPVDGSTTTVTLTDASGTYGAGGIVLAVPAPDPSVSGDPTRASLRDALHGAESGLRGCGVSGTLAGSAARSADPAGYLESDRAGTAPSDGKRKADLPMLFGGVGHRQNVRVNETSFDLLNPPTALHQQGMPYGGGVAHLDQARGVGWRSASPGPAPPSYKGGTVRSDLQPAGPLWITAYARVGANTTSVALVPGADSVYGAEACGGATTGVLHGWDCDASRWWRPDLGGARAPPGASEPAPGWTYRLRDLDCLDGAVVRGAPARASLVDASPEGACPA